MTLRPFFTYYGGKWRISGRYPPPTRATIIEPFAGAAGYALRYHRRDVVLVDKSPVIAGIWRYLIGTAASEVRDLPDLPDGGTVWDVAWPCDAARDLAGMWLTRGAVHPNRSPSAWMRDPRYAKWSWGPWARDRIAGQVGLIRHWRIIEGDYTDAPDIDGTWYVDPPYRVAGAKYPCGAGDIDFDRLGSWCRARRGQVIVCENVGADWLPFRPFLTAKANESLHGGKRSEEAVWTGP